MDNFAKTSATILALVLIVLLAGLIPAHAAFVRQGGRVCTAAGNQENIAAAADFMGGAIIAWEDNRGYRDIYAQRIDAYGRPLWSLDGIAVCAYPYGQYQVSIAPDLNGGAFIAWQDGRPNPNRDIYVQHIDASGAALWTADGVAVCQATNDQFAPVVCFDGTGGCILAWYDGRTSTQYDIYAQRVRADGNVAWSTDGVAVCTASGIQQDIRIVPDGKGGAIMAWSDYRSGGDIYAQKIRPNGTVAWAADGVAVCTATGIQQGPSIAFDNHYGAIITWSDQRGFYDIYVQRIDSVGASKWTANGVALCTNSEWQNYPVVAVDSDGGAIVAWSDNRTGDYDCYAQRVGSNGSVKWNPDGAPVCTAAGDCVNIGILPILDKAAGIVWSDSRSGANDIYAQGIDSTGMVLLDDDGMAICDTVNAQNYPIGVPDGSGGAFLAWVDFRGGTESDIYAARVSSQGELVATLLRNYTAAWRPEGVEISWTLSQEGAGTAFAVLRASGPGGAFTELDARDISRSGMTFSFIDHSAEPGASYVYRVEVSDEKGLRTLFETDGVSVPALPLTLYQNSPNPFNPSTTIRYYLPESCRVVLDVYDVGGAMIARLVEGYRERGSHVARWNGLDGNGAQASSGIYFYKLRAGKQVASRKMVLLR
jgi:hypothetical protein